ncbi:MAG: mechanosensitive ion channel, partial [Gammaproteobacteria bacterium]|nr:mechanosensitive ion channel [Gammaproteobacteria bacterium]
YQEVVFSVAQLTELQNDASKCVDDSESHLKMINQLLKSTEVENVTQLQPSDSRYLQDKKLYYAKQLSECRLFSYRSQEAILKYKNLMQKLSANHIFRRGEPIWKIKKTDWPHSMGEIDFNKMRAISGIYLFTETQLVMGGILLFFTIIVAIYVRSFLLRLLSSVETTHTVGCALLVVLSKFIVPVAFFGFTSVFLDLIDVNILMVPSLVKLSHALLVLTLSIAVTRFLFYPSSLFSGLFSFPTNWGRSFYRRILVLSLGLFLGYVVAITLREQTFPPILVDLVSTVYIAIISAITAWVFFLWHKSPHANQLQHATLVFFSTIFVVMLSALVVTECLGYHRLALFAISGLCLTVLYTICFVAFWRLVQVIYEWIDDNKYAASRKIRNIFGVKLYKKMYEIVLIKFAAQFLIFCLYLIALLRSWNISSNFVDSIDDGLLNGFKFSGLTVIPSRIILAILSFSVIFLIGRYIAASIARKHHFKSQEDTQIAISTIIIYISFAVAFLFALLTTGIDFTGLAIVAGALSVGVGLGLQNIVNNFVSGLILLIEKPIKPGDRIVIGKTEGFVRKIRIRSTQISTLAKEDVIVPNADLITQQVTNYMFRDRNSRVNCQVGVAYGSDINLVKKLLLEVASKHDDVVHNAPNEPIVFFSRFADSSLTFDLWCVIHDVNKKNFVVSDLNFAIDAAFRQHEINIAFPQRDVHIKDYVSMCKPGE